MPPIEIFINKEIESVRGLNGGLYFLNFTDYFAVTQRGPRCRRNLRSETTLEAAFTLGYSPVFGQACFNLDEILGHLFRREARHNDTSLTMKVLRSFPDTDADTPFLR